MKKRFIIGIGSSTDAQNKEFFRYLNKHHLNWWHWISNFWLIVDENGQLSASRLTDDLGEIYPNVNTIAIELEGDSDTWSGFGPAGEDNEKNMFKATLIYCHNCL